MFRLKLPSEFRARREEAEYTSAFMVGAVGIEPTTSPV